MSNPVALIEQLRAEGVVCWYSVEDGEPTLWTWAFMRKKHPRRRQLTRLLQLHYYEVICLLKLAALE